MVLMLYLRSLRSASGLGTGHLIWPGSRELDTQEGAQHRDGIVAPQSSVTRNNLLGHAHNPTGDTSVTGIFKLPSSPDFLSRRRPDGSRIVVVVMTEFCFVPVVKFS